VQHFSRVSACRRALSSHDAASRENRAFGAQRSIQSSTAQRGCRRGIQQHAQQATDGDESHANDWQPQCQTAASRCVVAISIQSVRRATAASRCAHTNRAWRWLEDAATRGRQREAGSDSSTPMSAARSPYPGCRASHGASRPNPSLKLSPNGGPRGPGRRYAVHSRQPGPRVPPLVPA